MWFSFSPSESLLTARSLSAVPRPTEQVTRSACGLWPGTTAARCSRAALATGLYPPPSISRALDAHIGPARRVVFLNSCPLAVGALATAAGKVSTCGCGDGKATRGGRAARWKSRIGALSGALRSRQTAATSPPPALMPRPRFMNATTSLGVWRGPLSATHVANRPRTHHGAPRARVRACGPGILAASSVRARRDAGGPRKRGQVRRVVRVRRAASDVQP